MILELQSFCYKVKRTDLDLVETKEEVGLVVGLSGDAFEGEEFQNAAGLPLLCNRAFSSQRSAGHDLPYHRLYHTTFSSSSTRVAGIDDVAQNTQS